jgi:integrase
VQILAARFDQLDLDKLRLFIPDAKAGEREQPITQELADLLRKEHEMRDDRDGWIFPSPHADSGTGHRARMDKPFREAVKAAGLDPKLVPTSCDTPRTRRSSGRASIYRRSRRSAGTRRSPW